MPNADDHLFLALTVDVDPDANRAVPGRLETASAGMDEGVRLEACFEGLALLLDMLDEAGLPATFFHEARTLEELRARQPELFERLAAAERFEHGCHGYRHEDFAASGAEEAPAGILQRAGAVIEDAFGSPPRAFRAPYCRLTPVLVEALCSLRYRYDASLTREPSADWGLRPYPLRDPGAAPGGGLYELALCRGRDGAGRPISGYLWQLFEGNRAVGDYTALVRSLRAPHPGGLMQVGLHPWHLIVSAEGRPLPSEGPAAPPALLAELLGRLTQTDGVAFTTAGAYLERAVPCAGGSASAAPRA